MIKKESLLYANRSDYDYIDSFEYSIPDADNKIDITHIGEVFIQPNSKWIEGLLALRNRIVSVFGLKHTAPDKNDLRLWEKGAQAGIFKVFDTATNEIVLGEDDKHLDFRVSLLLKKEGENKLISVTTLVKYHNGLGRCYFFFVKPFHRVIVPMTLKQKLISLSAFQTPFASHLDKKSPRNT